MLITFKSKAAADIIMYKEHAQRILDLLGKEIDRGIIVRDDTAKAIAIIEAAIAESRAHPVSDQVKQDVEHNHHENQEPVEQVSLGARAYPLLEMLRAANEQGHDVVWGV